MNIMATAAFFLAVLFSFTSPLKNDDLWWNLASGRWIVENSALPSDDPFSYTTTVEPSKRKAVILKGFWLSQAAFFLTYKAGGYGGLVVLKAALFTLVFFVLFMAMKGCGLGRWTSLSIIAPLVALSSPFEELRPQVFSFLGTLVLFIIIERGTNELRRYYTLAAGTALAAPAVMLIWANLHRGFIIGYAVLAVYVVGETIEFLRNRNALAKGALIKLILWGLAAALTSLINPNHINTLTVNLWELRYSISTMTIDEYLPPWKYASYIGSHFFLYGLYAVGAFTLLVLALSFRKVRLSHALLYAGFAAAALSSFRFCIFFILISVAISSRHIAALASRFQLIERLETLGRPISLVAAGILVLQAYPLSFISRGPLSTSVPASAADFIERRNLPDNLFNSYGMGGYLMWRLYPKHKVYMDRRAIDNNALLNYMAANMGKIDPVFEASNVNTVALEPFNPITLNIPGIVFYLLKDSRWKLAYLDGNSVIFVRASAMPSLTAINKELLWDALETTARTQMDLHPQSARPIGMLGQVRAARGMKKEARELLEKAYERK